ncbi:MAG: RNA polymerase sigma factor [Nocardioidaceae bacterium]
MTATTLSEAWGGLVTPSRAPDTPDRVSVWGDSAALFRAWRDGSREALDDLVRVLTPVLWHVVRSAGLDRDRSEDVVQTAWLTLVRHQASVSDPQAIAGWLITTARREAWRVVRAEARARPMSDEVIESRVPAQPAAEADVVTRDEGDRLWTCVRQLDDRCQRLLRTIAFDVRPDYGGIARDLNMPIGSIGPTRGRCLAKLKKLLGDSSGADHD